MIDLGKINLPNVVRHYMLANTPGYLYRHLREEPSVHALSESAAASELLDAITALINRPERTAQDTAIAYAMLVALSFQDYMSTRQALANWQPPNLTWAKHLASIITQPVIATTAVTLNAPSGRIIAPDRNETPTTATELRP